MKRLTLAAIMLLTALGMMAEKKCIVVYFSATGTTAKLAKEIAKDKDAALWEIVPAEPYTDADLDWRNKQSRSSLEMADPEERPMIKMCTNIMPYEEVYLGFPIWWGICPRIIDSWLENNVEMLEGKPIHLFCTSGGSGIDGAVTYLKKGYPSLKFDIKK
ncbi:MAG: flavodoxin [Bacteroidales bacterium]|nr:flavodoxin [Candidatus Colicola faecequi]